MSTRIETARRLTLGFWALDLLAESQITATPRHSAPGAGACQPAQRSGHQGRRLVWGLPRLASVLSTGIHDDRRSAACSAAMAGAPARLRTIVLGLRVLLRA